MEDLRYPVGKFAAPETFDKKILKQNIKTISRFPKKIKSEVKNLSEKQLGTPYRDGGWTVKQVVHHVADSHMNCYIRFKLAITEDNPVIKPYNEADWAKTADYTMDIKLPLALLKLIHEKWVYFMKSFSDEQWQRTFTNPETKKTFPLW